MEAVLTGALRTAPSAPCRNTGRSHRLARSTAEGSESIGLGVKETPLDDSICAHAILQHDTFVVSDTRDDPHFNWNPLVTGPPGLRSYAGALLKADGHALGTVCVLDHRPRVFGAEQIRILESLARQTMALLELRRLRGAG